VRKISFGVFFLGDSAKVGAQRAASHTNVLFWGGLGVGGGCWGHLFYEVRLFFKLKSSDPRLHCLK